MWLKVVFLLLSIISIGFSIDSSCYQTPSSYAYCKNDMIDLKDGQDADAFDLQGSAPFTSYSVKNALRSVQGFWIKKPFQWSNGFVTQFNIKKSYQQLPLACINNPSAPNYCTNEGFALVLQPSGVKQIGLGGSGLGYQFLRNILAIEFDFKYTEGLSDPAGPHISVHEYINKDANADEHNSIAYCYASSIPNFWTDFSTNLIKIEYINNNLRIYINNTYVMGAYNLNIAQDFYGVPLYMTITDSIGTADVSRTTTISDWTISLVRPNPTKIQTYLLASNQVNVNAAFDIAIDIKNLCGQNLIPDSNLLDSANQISATGFTSTECEILNRDERWKSYGKPTIRPTFILTMKCKTKKTFSIQVQYQSVNVGAPISINVLAGVFYKAYVEALQERVTLDDLPIKFYIVPKDTNGNIVDLENMYILWGENSGYHSSSDLQWSKQADAKWLVVFNAAGQSAKYTIKSFLLDRDYSFSVYPGIPYAPNSFLEVLNPSSQEIVSSIVAGTTVTIQVFLKDKSNLFVKYDSAKPGSSYINNITANIELSNGKTIPIASSSIQYIDAISAISKSKGYFQFSLPLTVATNNVIKVYFNKNQISTCNFNRLTSCSVLVSAGAPYLPKFLLYWSDAKGSYFENQRWNANVTSNLGFFLLHRDLYENVIPTPTNPKLYTAILSGNQMTPLSLCLDSSGNYASINFCSQDLNYGKRLIGRPNYNLQIKDSTNLNNWTIAIMTNKDDQDAGNGDYQLSNTVFTCGEQVSVLAGTTLYCNIYLKTGDGLRFNAWIPTSDLQVKGVNTNSIAPNLPAITIVPAAKEGQYSFSVCVREVGEVSLSLAIKTVSFPSKIIYSVRPGVANSALITKEYIASDTTLKGGLAGVKIDFLVQVFDIFNNPTSFTADLTSNGTSISNTAIYVQIGLYKFSIQRNSPGLYTIESAFFKSGATLIKYYVKFTANRPCLATTTAELINNLNINPAKAGATAKLEITPKDCLGNLYSNDDLNSFLPQFTIYVGNNMIPSTNYIVNSGKIQYETTLTAVGQYAYASYLKINDKDNSQIKCNMKIGISNLACQIEIIPDNVAIDKTKLFLAIDKNRILYNKTSDNIIDNKKIQSPVYILSFFDQYLNPTIDKNLPTSSIGYINASIPGVGIKSYVFNGSIDGIEYKFELSADKNTDVFSEQAYNKDSKLSFNIYNLLYKLIILGDDRYTDALPTEKSVTLVGDNPVTKVAGQTYQFSLKLTAEDGKLWSQLAYNGWYPSPLSKYIQISPDSISYNVQKSTLKGSYIITVQSNVAGTYNLKVKFSLDNGVTFLTTEKYIALTYIPGDLAYLDVQKDINNFADCPAGQSKKLDFKMFDIYYNLITTSPFVDCKYSPSETAVDYIPSIDTPGYLTVKFKCAKVGTLKLSPPQFVNFVNAKLNTDVSIKVTYGVVNAAKSCASLDKKSMLAGDTVTVKIIPYDLFENKIPIDNGKEDMTVSKFSISYQRTKNASPNIISNIQIAIDNSYYFATLPLSTADLYTFQVNYTKIFLGISCCDPLYGTQSLELYVNPNTPIFSKSVLAQYDAQSNSYVPYNKKMFQNDILIYPKYILTFFDLYDNSITYEDALTKWNIKWDVSLLFTGKFTFTIPFENSLYKFSVKEDATVASNWKLLLPNADLYELKVKRNDIITETPLAYNLNLTGTNTDTGVSNLPISIQDTVITPSSLTLTAGIAGEFILQIRTQDTTKRQNGWFDDPTKNIFLSFSLDNGNKDILSYTVAKKNDLKGTYKITVLSKKAYSLGSPNQITFTINNVVFFGPAGKTPSLFNLIVFSEPTVKNWIATDDKGVKLTTQLPLPSKTVDDLYTAYFQGLDTFGNIVDENKYTLQDTFSIKPENFKALIIEKRPNCMRKISFQPMKPSVYSITADLTNQKYSLTITNGAFSFDTSYGTMIGSDTINAGSSAKIALYQMDQWGNSIPISTGDVKYYYFEPSSSYQAGIASAVQTEANITFIQQLIIKGIYYFKLTYKGMEVKMNKNAINVVPDTSVLEKAKLYYFDVISNQFVYWNPTFVLQEENRIYTPKYKLVAYDTYGNMHDPFPEIEKDAYNLTLSYENMTQPLNYEKINMGTIQDNGLYFTVSDLDNDTYFFINFTIKSQNIFLIKNAQKSPYFVQLMGAELASDTADVDYTKTKIEPTEIKIVAGSISSSNKILIEFLTINNRRKEDFYWTFKYSITPSDKYSIRLEKGSLKGKYVLTISGEIANWKGEKAHLILYNNATPITKIPFINITVLPAEIDHINVLNTPLPAATTDLLEYLFTASAYDPYDNIIDYSSFDINTALTVAYPNSTTSQESPSITSWLNGNIMEYNVKPVLTGEYGINGKYLKDSSSFSILSGLASVKYTTFKTNITSSILPTTICEFTINPFDSHNNKIIVSQSIIKNFSLVVNGPEYKNSNETLTVDINRNAFVYTLKLVKSGETELKLYVNNQYKSSLFINVIPGEIDIDHTIFYQDNKPIQAIIIPYASSNLGLSAYFYDSHDNLISNIGSNDKLSSSAFISGNNMIDINMNTAKQSEFIIISLPPEKSSMFTRLIAASSGYTFNFTLNDNGKNKVSILPLIITGDTGDKGNGPYFVDNTEISPKSFETLIAGEDKYFTYITLKTKENKRFCNWIVDSANITLEEDIKTVNLNYEKLVINIGKTEKSNTFVISFYATKLNLNQRIFYAVVENNKVPIPITLVKVIPTLPSAENTLILKDLPQNMTFNIDGSVEIQLFDKFGNQYPKEYEQCTTLKVINLVGISKIIPDTSAQNLTCKFTVTPIAPPRSLEFDLLWNKIVDNTSLNLDVLINKTFSSLILTTLNSTQIGGNISGVAVDQDLFIYIKLIDNIGDCFWDTRNVNIKVTGPFKSAKDIDTNPLVESFMRIFNNIAPNNSIVSNCSVYPLTLKANLPTRQSIQYIGYYQVDVEVKDGSSSAMSTKFRQIKMTSGKTYGPNCVLSMSEAQSDISILTGNDTLFLKYGSKLKVQLQKYDIYKNIIDDARSDNVSFNFADLNPSNYTVNTEDYINGTYQFTFNVRLLGFVRAQAIINGDTFKISNLNRNNVPTYIYIKPGKCYIPTSILNNTHIINKVLPIGNISFNCICKDEFGNDAELEVYNFTASIRLGADSISYYVSPKNVQTNVYYFTFTTPINGNYSIQVLLNNNMFSNSFIANVLNQICSGDTPYYCSDTKKCVKNISFCTLPDINSTCVTANPKKPFSCPVNGINQCVGGLWECDCPPFYTKCKADNKCVPASQVEDICSSISLYGQVCQNGYVLCIDGLCKPHSNECASQLGCPPGYRLCADQTCMKATIGCPKVTVPVCPEEDLYYVCEDLSCKLNFLDCPTRITCPNPSMVICPDKTCANSELECKNPPDCAVKGLVLCPDNSCARDKSSCPQQVTCHEFFSRCSDNTCKSKCSTSTAASFLI